MCVAHGTLWGDGYSASLRAGIISNDIIHLLKPKMEGWTLKWMKTQR